jgi:hypothetical protein
MKRKVATGIILIIGAVVVIGWVLPCRESWESSKRIACMNNLRQIGLALKQYAIDHDDKFPKTLEELENGRYLSSIKNFQCRARESGGYIFNLAVTNEAVSTDSILVADDGPHGADDGVNAFYAGGHVGYIKTNSVAYQNFVKTASKISSKEQQLKN